MKQPSNIISGLRVDVYKDNFEKAFRQWKKKVQNAGIVQEVRDRQHYIKPSERRQKNMNAAKRRNANQN